MTTATEIASVECEQNRADEIRDATRTLVTAMDRYSESDSDSFPRWLDAAISSSLTIVMQGGDVPHKCMSLFHAFVEMGEAWAAVQSGELVNDQGLPTIEFWRSVELVRTRFDELNRRTAAAARPMESVAELLDDMRDSPLKWQQVARMYGKSDERGEWSGPFFDEFGGIREDLIRKEANEPGSVIGEKTATPLEEQRQEAMALARRMQAEVTAAIAAAEHGDRSASVDDSVEDLIREGHTPNAVASMKDVTVEEVYRVARQIGVVMKSRDELLAEALDATDGEQREQPVAPRPAMNTVSGDELEQAMLNLPAESLVSAMSSLKALQARGLTADIGEITVILDSQGGDE